MTAPIQAEDGPQLPSEADPVSDAVVDGRWAGFSSDHENFTVTDEDEGFLRVVLRPGGRITAEDGTLVRERCLALTGGTGASVLLQVTGVESVSRGAVRYFSEAVTITAFAILGSTPVDRVIAHGRHGLPTPQCPTRYFTDEQEALAWLRDLPGTPRRVLES